MTKLSVNRYQRKKFRHIPAMSTCLASASHDCTTVLIPRLWSYFGHHNGQLAGQGIRIAKLVPQRDRVLRCSSIRILVNLNGEHTHLLCEIADYEGLQFII